MVSKVINLLTCLFSLKQFAWVWSPIFVALLFVRLLQSIPVTFSAKVFKALSTTLDHVIHKQPLMHVQRKVYFRNRDFVISMINSFKSTRTFSINHVMSGFKIFKIFSNTATLFSCLVTLLLLNRDVFFKIYWYIA